MQNMGWDPAIHEPPRKVPIQTEQGGGQVLICPFCAFPKFRASLRDISSCSVFNDT